MHPPLRTTQVSSRQHAFLVACLACVLPFALLSCDRSNRSPDWNTPPSTAESSPEAAPAKISSASESKLESVPTPVPAETEAVAEADNLPDSSPHSKAKGSLRFIHYNVQNWLVMDRYANNNLVKNAPKPDSEKLAVVQLLAKHSPDVLGLCEIGTAADLAEIQTKLKSAGLDLPHSQYTGGSDTVRHLGLLSRFPITSTAKPAESDFRLRGQSFSINRGILDATILAHQKSYRFIGVHLKSKREVEEADQSEIRIHEARLLRKHVDSILANDSNARLIVYGDFNDTRPSPAFKSATGSYSDPSYLTAIPFKDSKGDAWTHYWKLHDIYSRIDYITVTRALRTEVDFRASHIIDDASWNDASDHRPILAIFR